MPKIDDIDLPVVSLSDHDADLIAAKLADKTMPIEAMIEVAIYIKREREKANALEVIEKVMRGRIEKAYADLKPEQRETRRAEVGMVTYTDAGEKIVARDRDFIIENLTDEQIRITYQPDLKALATILKKDHLERLTKKEATKSRITLRDIPASDDYSELDY